MNSYQVAVVPDEAAPTAGTAIVRIVGLRSWPDGATVRLLPIDDVAVPPNSEGWPWEPIKPQNVQVTDTGVDIVLGTEVVASPRLLPGTPLTIKIGAANLEVESRWPAIVPVVRRKAGTVAMTASQLLAAKAERERAERVAAERRKELAEIAVQSARDAASEEQFAASSAKSAPVRSGGTAQLARLLPTRRQDGTADKASTTGPLPIAPPGSMGQLARFTAATSANVVPMPTPPSRLTEHRSGTLRGFVIGLVTTAAAMVLLVALAPARWWPATPAGTATIGSAADKIAATDLKSIFKDIAAAGPQSPRNKAAANVDVATALSLADHSLRGQRSPSETEEAEFWLKRALSVSMGSQEVGWALTQLGTIYATAGTPSHSYVKAHALWELAAAQGDPVAHCFLGALYEHGLGIAKDKKAAREHYLAADALGACRSAKEAAARLSE